MTKRVANIVMTVGLVIAVGAGTALLLTGQDSSSLRGQFGGFSILGLGLELDATANGLGKRSKRYAMVVDNGVVKTLNVEAPGAFEVSSAEAILKAL